MKKSLTEMYAEYFTSSRIKEAKEEYIKRLSEKKDKILEEAVREFAKPQIKGEITRGKLRWRGLRLIEQPSTGYFWIEQRGERITPKYRLS